MTPTPSCAPGSTASADPRHLRSLEPRDLISSLALAIGFRDWAYRKNAVEALGLREGDRVVEIGCGTGRNLPLLEHAVGSAGTIILVDLSPKMLARTRARAARAGWSNVEFVLADAAAFDFPVSLDGVLSTHTLVAVPGYDRVVQNAFRALKNGRRLAILDQKLPTGWASRLVPLVDRLSRPVPYSELVAERRVWESIQRHFGDVRVEEFYFGFFYLAVGEKRSRA